MKKLILAFLALASLSAQAAYTPKSVTSPAAKETLLRVLFGGATANSSCTSSPCTIRYQSGSWVSSVTRGSAGSYFINFASGNVPLGTTCVCSAGSYGTAPGLCDIYANTPMATAITGISVTVRNANSISSNIDAQVSVVCVGPSS